MALALKVASQMEQTRGGPPAVFSAHTLKPLDRDGVARLLHDFDQVIVVEEHSRQGGLGAQVKQIAWDSGARCRLQTFALQDDFLHVYGSQDELRRAHGLSVETILAQVR
jgi:transketolase